jgi:hypothetical protein
MRAIWAIAAACLLGGLATGAGVLAAEPCTGSKWDIRRESALFASTALPLAAGKNPDTAPEVGVDRLYRVDLVPQNQVTFAASPGRSTLTDGYAGVARLTLPTAGIYRVSVDTPLWIDVVGNGALAPVHDFEGLHGCDAPRKLVEFELSGARSFVLQLSGSGRPSVRLTLTAVAASTPAP